MPKRTGKQSEQTEVREARLDRRSVHGEESITISGSIGVKLVRGQSCQLALNIKIRILKMFTAHQ